MVRQYLPQAFAANIQTNENFPPQSFHTNGIIIPPAAFDEQIEEVLGIFDDLLFEETLTVFGNVIIDETGRLNVYDNEVAEETLTVFDNMVVEETLTLFDNMAILETA